MTSKRAGGGPAAAADARLQRTMETIRLENIERSMRSIASILDTREIHAIQPVTNTVDISKKEAAKNRKLRERRIHDTAKDIRVAGAVALAKLDAQGVKVETTVDGFENEENIWRSKSHNPSYLAKRRFDDPELHNFAKHLDPQDRKQYQQISKDRLYSISTNLKESFAEAKLNMDRLGIFHPEINAQRSSSQYIIKLYKGISASNLEDRALRELQRKQREEAERQRSLENPDAATVLIAARQQQAQKSIGGSGNALNDALGALQTAHPASGGGDKTSTANHGDASGGGRKRSGPRYLQTSQRVEEKAAENRERARKIQSRSASRGGARKSDASNPNRASSPDITALRSDARDSARGILSQSAGAANTSKHKGATSETYVNNAPNKEAKGEAAASIITGGLFRNKYKMAGMQDPRKILEEENNRLNQSTSDAMKPLAGVGGGKPSNGLGSSDGLEPVVPTDTLDDRTADAFIRNIQPVGMMTLGLATHRGSAKPVVSNEVWKDIAELNQSLQEANMWRGGTNCATADLERDNMQSYGVIKDNRRKFGSLMSGANIGYTLSQKLPTFDEFQNIFVNNAEATKAAVNVLQDMNDEAQERRRGNRAVNASSNNVSKQAPYAGMDALLRSSSGVVDASATAGASEGVTTVTNLEGATTTTSSVRKQAKPIDLTQLLSTGGDQRFRAFQELQAKSKDFALLEAIRRRKQERAMEDDRYRRTSNLGLKTLAVLQASAENGKHGGGFVNMFGDPTFDPAKMRRLAAVTKQLQNSGGGAGATHIPVLYDEDGRRIKPTEILEAQGRTRPRKSQSGDNKVQSASDANAGTINSARSGDSSDSSYDSDDASYTSLDAPSPKSGGANLSPASAQEETKGSSPGSRKANRNRSPNLSSAPSPALKKIYDKNPNYKLTPLVSDQGLDKGQDTSALVQSIMGQCWDILSVPVTRRVDFMSKYSTPSYCSALHEAVNMWSQAAVYCSARIALSKVCRQIQHSETVPKTKTAIHDILVRIIEGTAVIPQIPKSNRAAFGAAEVAKSFMQRRKSTFVRIDQPEDVRHKLTQVFSTALDEMEFLLRAEGHSLDEVEHVISMYPQRGESASESKKTPRAARTPTNAGSPTAATPTAQPSDAQAVQPGDSGEQDSDSYMGANIAVIENVLNLFKSMGHYIDNNIISIAKMASVDLDETIYHQSMSVIDWVASVKYPSLLRKERLAQLQAMAGGHGSAADGAGLEGRLTSLSTGQGGEVSATPTRTQADTSTSLDAADMPNSLKKQSFRMEPIAL